MILSDSEISNAPGQCAFLWFVCLDNNKAKIMIQLREDGLLGTSGGKVEKGETIIDALFREIKEEIGYDIHKYVDTTVIPLLQIKDKSTGWIINSFYKVVDAATMESLQLEFMRGSHSYEVAGLAVYDVKPKTIRNIKKQKFSGTGLEEFSTLVNILSNGNI